MACAAVCMRPCVTVTTMDGEQQQAAACAVLVAKPAARSAGGQLLCVAVCAGTHAPRPMDGGYSVAVFSQPHKRP
jgi:hypothetical protein